MLWIIVIIVAVVAATILFMYCASHGKPDWYQQEMYEEQMRAISKMKSKQQSENECEESGSL